jgi:hypothetical protein
MWNIDIIPAGPFCQGKTSRDFPLTMFAFRSVVRDMRLSASERTALEQALDGIQGEVYLYGSRTDNSARGGDIDILLFTDAPAYRTAQIVEWRLNRSSTSRL